MFTVVLMEHAGGCIPLRRSEPDELGDLRAAALRELFEETGIAEAAVTRFAFRRALLHAWPTRLSMVLLLYFTGSVATAALPSCPEGTLAWVAPAEFAALDVIDSTRPVLPLLVSDVARDPMGLEPPRLGVAPVAGGSRRGPLGVGSVADYPAAVKRVLITGMSGTGKSTLLDRLAALGYKTVDTDYGDWHEWVDGPDGRDRVWREDRIADLLSTEDAEALFVSGTVSNQGKFYPRFDHVVLLSASTPVLLERLGTRTNNPYGKSPAEIAEVLGYVETVEPLLRRRATAEIDTSVPLDQVVEAVLRLVRF